VGILPHRGVLPDPSFPLAQALTAPELFPIDPVATFDFAVLLRAPGPDVAMLDACLSTVSLKARENSLPLSVCTSRIGKGQAA